MNRIINPLSIVLMAAVLSFSLIGCQSTDPVESVPEIEVPVPVPAAEAPAPAPVVEEEDEVPAITGSLSFYGYTLSYEAVPGEARVTYPQFITEADVGPGEMVVTFPESVTVEDAAAVVNLLSADLAVFAAPYMEA